MTDKTPYQADSAEPALPGGVPLAEREAIEWLVRMTSGEATAAEQAAFARWRAASPAHEAALAMARRLWQGVGQALPARAAPRRRRWPALALAASLLLAVALGVGLRLHSGGGADQAAGGGAVLELADTAGRCRLTLGGGAGYFDVTPNPQPAADAADETQVRMLDAAFSVRAEAAAVLVTVTDGRVEVADGGAARVLTAGQRLRCRAGREVAARPAATAADRGTRWARWIAARALAMLRQWTAQAGPAPGWRHDNDDNL